ncbi:hypothetical protein HYT52_01125 [Candidatus Woesearchaeota archaeon]|nr:hypothetical protein [Candidatus Woesearchaeota archaeon]
MGQFDAGNILDDLLGARESYFLIAREGNDNEYVVQACGAPAICHSLDEATENARGYIADRPDQDLEIRLRKVSITPAGRITRGKMTYVAEPTDVSGVKRVVTSYHVGEGAIAEYKALVADAASSDENFQETPAIVEPSIVEILRSLNSEFGDELRTIQAHFPQYDYFGVHFGHPTEVYISNSRPHLIQVSTALNNKGKLAIPFVISTR